MTFNNNIEYFAFGAGLGSNSTGAAAAQSQRNYAWRDYGNRVGLWYYFDLLDEFALPGAHNVNSAVLEHCPEIVERLNGRGDEYVGHGKVDSGCSLARACARVLVIFRNRRLTGPMNSRLKAAKSL